MNCANVTMPPVDRDLKSVAQQFESIELVVDQRFKGTDIERPHAASGIADHAGTDRKSGGLGLSSGGGRRDDHVPVTREDWIDGPLLDVAQFRPPLVPYPSLDAWVKTAECSVVAARVRA